VSPKRGKLRVYVNVPQNYVPSVPPGTKATIRVPEHPDKTFSGTVEASAQAVDPNSGTTLMQLIVDNSTGQLMPGDYASIHLQIPAAANVLSVPSERADFRRQGLSIATGDADKPRAAQARCRSNETWCGRRTRHWPVTGGSGDPKSARWNRQWREVRLAGAAQGGALARSKANRKMKRVKA